MNNDLISRSALLKQMKQIVFDTPIEGQFAVQSAFEKIETLVDVAPAADAEPVRHGRWIMPTYDIWDTCICSVCGGYAGINYKHCPNCGAKMDLEG